MERTVGRRLLLYVVFAVCVFLTTGSSGCGGGSGGDGDTTPLEWRCEEWADLGICQCSFASSGGSVVHSCSPNSFTVPAKCCGIHPGKGEERCDCAAVPCQKTSSGCECDWFIRPGPGVTSSCTGEHCCKGLSPSYRRCRCGSEPCTAEEQPIAKCDGWEVDCDSSYSSVTSCTSPQIP